MAKIRVIEGNSWKTDDAQRNHSRIKRTYLLLVMAFLLLAGSVFAATRLMGDGKGSAVIGFSEQKDGSFNGSATLGDVTLHLSYTRDSFPNYNPSRLIASVKRVNLSYSDKSVVRDELGDEATLLASTGYEIAFFTPFVGTVEEAEKRSDVFYTYDPAGDPETGGRQYYEPIEPVKAISVTFAIDSYPNAVRTDYPAVKVVRYTDATDTVDAVPCTVQKRETMGLTMDVSIQTETFATAYHLLYTSLRTVTGSMSELFAYEIGDDVDIVTISSEEEMKQFAQYVEASYTDSDKNLQGKIFQLQEDITLTQWPSMGTETAPVQGITFDGNGKIITLKYTNLTLENAALFGVLRDSSVVGLTVEGSVFALPDEDEGIEVKSAAAIAGDATSCTFIECVNNARIEATATAEQDEIAVGGIVGIVRGDSTFERCENTLQGNINVICDEGSANISVGGIVGIARSASGDIVFKRCNNKGDMRGVSLAEVNIGGIVANCDYNSSGSGRLALYECAVQMGTTSSGGMNAGALVGRFSAAGKDLAVYNSASMQGERSLVGLVDKAENVTVKNSWINCVTPGYIVSKFGSEVNGATLHNNFVTASAYDGESVVGEWGSVSADDADPSGSCGNYADNATLVALLNKGLVELSGEEYEFRGWTKATAGAEYAPTARLTVTLDEKELDPSDNVQLQSTKTGQMYESTQTVLGYEFYGFSEDSYYLYINGMKVDNDKGKDIFLNTDDVQKISVTCYSVLYYDYCKNVDDGTVDKTEKLVKTSYVMEGSSVVEPSVDEQPTRPGKKFQYWALWNDIAGELQRYDFDTKITEPMTIYASWEFAGTHGVSIDLMLDDEVWTGQSVSVQSEDGTHLYHSEEDQTSPGTYILELPITGLEDEEYILIINGAEARTEMIGDSTEKLEPYCAYSVIFYDADGKEIDRLHIATGKKAYPADISKLNSSHMMFNGWQLKGSRNEYDFSEPITATTELEIRTGTEIGVAVSLVCDDALWLEENGLSLEVVMTNSDGDRLVLTNKGVGRYILRNNAAGYDIGAYTLSVQTRSNGIATTLLTKNMAIYDINKNVFVYVDAYRFTLHSMQDSASTNDMGLIDPNTIVSVPTQKIFYVQSGTTLKPDGRGSPREFAGTRYFRSFKFWSLTKYLEGVDENGNKINEYLNVGAEFSLLDNPATRRLNLYAQWTPQRYVSVIIRVDGSTEKATHKNVVISKVSDESLRYELSYNEEGKGFFTTTEVVEPGMYHVTIDGTVMEKQMSINEEPSGEVEFDFYTITFYSEGEILYGPIERLAGDIITSSIVPTPERNGYRFLGWFEGTEFVDTNQPLHDFSLPIDTRIFVCAGWEKTGLGIRLYKDGELWLQQSNGSPTIVKLFSGTLEYILSYDAEEEIYTTSAAIADGNYQISVNDEVAPNQILSVSALVGQKTLTYHTVLFMSHLSDAEPYATKFVLTNDLVSPPDEPPTKVGCMFRGWLYETDGTAFRPNRPITEKIVLYADWNEVGLGIELTLNDSPWEGQTIVLYLNGSAYKNLYYDEEQRYYTTDYLADASYDIVLNDVMLSDKFTVVGGLQRKGIAYYTVSFYEHEGDYDAGAEAYEVQVVRSGDRASVPDAPIRTGYRFEGWRYMADGEAFNASKIITEELALYADWHFSGFGVSLNLDKKPWENQDIKLYLDGEERYTMTYDAVNEYYTTDVIVPNNVYDIYLNDEHTGKTFVVTNNYGKTIMHYFTVSFMNGDSVYNEQILTSGAYPEEPSVPVRKGYKFMNWATESGEVYKFGSVTTPLVLYASWQLRGFGVSLKLDGEPWTDLDSVGLNLSLRVDGKIAYTLEYDWDTQYYASDSIADGTYNVYLGESNTGETVTLTIENLAGSIGLEYYSVSFISAGQQYGQTQYLKAESILKEPTPPIRDGYRFTGWKTDRGELFDFSTTVTKTTVLEAEWNYIGFGVDLQLNGKPWTGQVVTLRTDGKVAYKLAYDSESKYYTSSVAVVNGSYNVYLDETNTNKSLSVEGNAGSVGVYYYSVTCYNDSRVWSVQNIQAESVPKEPSMPVKNGFRFGGWQTSTGRDYNFSESVTSTTEVHAYWVEIGLGVELKLDGDPWKDQTVTLRTEGKTAYTLNYSAGKKLYTYTSFANGTYDVYLGESDTGTDLAIENNAGMVSMSFYTVTFYNGTAVHNTQQVRAGSMAQAPQDPTKTGCTFLGWVVKQDSTERYVMSNPVIEKKDIYAAWSEFEELGVRVTLDDEVWRERDVTLQVKGEIKYQLQLDSATERYTSSMIEDGTYEIFVDKEAVNETLVVRNGGGNLTVAYYSLKFYNGDKLFATQQILSGTGMKTLEPPKVIGRSFIYWVTELGGSVEFTMSDVITETRSVYASWEDQVYRVTGNFQKAVLAEGEGTYYRGYTGQLEVEEGFLRPKEIFAVMNGEPFKTFSYSRVTGQIEIPANAMIGDVEFNATGTEIVEFAVSSSIQGGILYGASASNANGYRGTLVSNAGYDLPQEITASMGGEQFTAFRYDALSGKIEIQADDVTADIVFYGACVSSQRSAAFQVMGLIGNGKLDGPTESRGEAYEATIVPNAGYALPSNVVMVVGGKRFTTFSYNKETGKLTVAIGKITGNVSVAATCPFDEDAALENDW